MGQRKRDRKTEYGEALDLIQSYYEDTDASVQGKVYALEAGLIGCDISLFAFRFAQMSAGLFNDNLEDVQGNTSGYDRLRRWFLQRIRPIDGPRFICKADVQIP